MINRSNAPRQRGGTVKADSVYIDGTPGDAVVVGSNQELISAPSAAAVVVEDVLAAPYTLLTAGAKVFEVTAPVEGIYLVESFVEGEVYYGVGNVYNGDCHAYIHGDIDERMSSPATNLISVTAVTGVAVYKRTATPAYDTSPDMYFYEKPDAGSSYNGNRTATYQRGVLWISAGGKLEFFFKDDATLGIPEGGYTKIDAGSKFSITLLHATSRNPYLGTP